MSAVSSQVGSGAKPQPPTILVHFQGERTLLVAFKMHGLKHQKTAFLHVSQIIVRVQAIENPHNQIIVRVRTCGPSRDRRLGYGMINPVQSNNPRRQSRGYQQSVWHSGRTSVSDGRIFLSCARSTADE